MATIPRKSQDADAPRLPARDLIEAVLENLRRNLEPLKYSTLAPSRFVVFLHPDEFARVEQIVPVLQAQTSRALDEELAKLNAPSIVQRYAGRWLGSAPPVENVAREWQIEFVADADGELDQGDILIHSELALPGAEALGAGQRTRRIATMHVGQRTTTREQTVTETRPAAGGAVVARLHYEDDAGPHTFDISRDSVSIGRGGQSHRVDLRLDASVDVSREHLRIRRDPQGKFFITDLSMLGTTVNGRAVPRGYDESEDGRRENGVEAELPDGAQIVLANLVHMRFEVVR
jgi:hypothetical protein